MLPERELIRLAAQKAALRGRIGVQRAQCAQAATRVVRPLEWIDVALAGWRLFSPLAQFAAVPLALLLQRSSRRGPRRLGALLRWGPVVFGALRGMGKSPAR